MMNNPQPTLVRYFVSYSGVKLPLKLVNEISSEGLHNRNTYYRGYFNEQDKMLYCQKIVYGEIESEHVYTYYENGVLQQAKISEDDEVRHLYFDELGAMVSA
jgi:Family of unknown function (DUF6156)